MPQISVIIPIYNSYEYLGRCLKSLQNQTLQDFEVIIIDDGSENIPNIDSPLDIKFFKFNSNRGTLLARKEGIKQSSGEYIIFVDSDDELESAALKKMYRIAKEGQYDIVQSSIREMRKGGVNVRIFAEKEVFDEPDICSYIFNEGTIYIWSKLIRKEVVDEIVDLIPNEYIVVQEDTLLNCLLSTKAKRMKILKEPLCIYNRGTGLTTKYRNLPIEVFEKYCTSMKAYKFIKEYMDSLKGFEKGKSALERKAFQMTQVLKNQINRLPHISDRMKYQIIFDKYNS